jgi:hypothetical protein
VNTDDDKKFYSVAGDPDPAIDYGYYSNTASASGALQRVTLSTNVATFYTRNQVIDDMIVTAAYIIAQNPTQIPILSKTNYATSYCRSRQLRQIKTSPRQLEQQFHLLRQHCFLDSHKDSQ